MSSQPAPLFFCIHIAEFAAQALLRLRPALAGKPVVVVEGKPPVERSCALTRQARQLGARPGMTRTELESFPGLEVLNRIPAEEASAVQALLEAAAGFTPSLQQLPRNTALTVALNMTGCDRLFGTPKAIGHKLLRMARDLGLTARVAASTNLHTAACQLRVPGDVFVLVPPGQEAAAMQNLPLAALDLTADCAETFGTWGLRTCGELAALPTLELIARLGQEGHRVQRLARGEELHLFLPIEPPLALREYLAFDAPLDNLDSLLFVLGPMLDQLIVRARTRALLLASLTVCLHLERAEDAADRNGNEDHPAKAEHPTHQRVLKPALPLDDRTHLLKLLQLDLQSHPAPAAILAITLSAEPGQRPGVQSGLFSPQLPEPMRLEVTLARIAALVGEDRVGQAVLTDTHHPSDNFRVEPLRLSGAPANSTLADGPFHLRSGLALRRLRPPYPAHVWHTDGRPYAFSVQSNAESTRYTVRQAYGPWRCSGQWWSGIAWSQEQWDIDAVTHEGTRMLCLLTHDLLFRHWQMEAMYD